MPSRTHPSRPARQAGFSLVELMVSVVVGLVIIASLSVLFANNSRARQEMEKSSQQIENGRYAVQYLRDDLRLAGYWGEFNPSSLTPASVPDPSLTTNAAITDAIPISVQGYHFGISVGSYSTLPTGLSTLLTDRRSNSDVIVVRRASTCYAGPDSAESSCSAQDVSTSKYFQTTLCATQLNSLATASQFVISTTASVFNNNNSLVTSAPTYFTQRDCTTKAVTRAVNVHIYYVTNNDVSGDGIPTLKMLSLGADSFGSPVAIAEGIETIQVEYGMDDGSNGGSADDGIPDQWKSDPISGAASTTAQLTALKRITAVKLHVLARNTQTSGGFTDTRQYILGSTASTDNTFGAYNDGYKRHVYTSLVRLANVAGRLGQ